MSNRMYKPKQDNIEKLNRYIEKLKEDGDVFDGHSKGDTNRRTD